MSVLITRHKATIQLFKELDIINENTEIIEHVNNENIHKITGQDVIGILPFDLAAQCNSVLTPLWDTPLEARGREWNYEETKIYFKGVRKYKVSEIRR